VAELVDRAGEPLGDLPFACDVQGAANVSVAASMAALLVSCAASIVLSAVALAASIVAWLVEREIRKPTIATATEPPSKRVAPPISADSTTGSMPGCYEANAIKIERGRRAGMSDRASLPPRSGSGRSGRSDLPRGTVTMRMVSLISSLIHVRVPAYITVYSCSLSRIDRPSWSVLDSHP
jgi:hypothetical protein